MELLQRDRFPASSSEAEGFALAMIKMTFNGEADDLTDTVMANWRYFLPGKTADRSEGAAR